MIHYRSFRNDDPPKVVGLWNTCLAGGRAVPLPGQGTTLLEYFTFAKPYFDPAGLILALDGGDAVGLVHAGFAPRAGGEALDTGRGVICALGVLASHRRQGVATELLRRAEDYLRTRGATATVAGPMAPDNPFTFGLYGGADSAGFVESHPAARPFLEARGYQVARSCGIFRRRLETMTIPNDPRFAGLRARYDIIAAPYSQAGWWRECVLGPIEAVSYRLEDKATRQSHAEAVLWDMDLYYPSWSAACVGLIDLAVEEKHRRQGLASYLLAQVLRHLRDQPFHLFEARADLANEAGLGLLRSLQFEQVEVGHSYQRG